MRASLSSAGALIASYCLIGSTLAVAPSGSAAEDTFPGNRELTITTRYVLPLAEFSGLALTSAGEGNGGGGDKQSISLYAVGDATYEVVTFYTNKVGTGMSVKNAASALGGHAKNPSQWEAVALDGLDTVCMLSETSSTVSCLDRRLDENKGIIKLDTSPLKELNRLWGNRPNSRGEGMLLMKNGHILILKEKKPSLLIEFGPAGDAPMGYGPDTFLRPGEAFILPSPKGAAKQDLALSALKVWEFSDRVRELASDASELALGPDGRVYLLSQESLVLIRLEKVLKPDESKAAMDDDAWWSLPTKIGKAEALGIDAEMHPWIGIDLKQKGKPNLFRLSPLRQGTP